MKVVTNSLQLSISFHGQRDAPCRQAASAASCNLFPCATVSTGICFRAEKPCVSDRMMAQLFERIAPSWTQSKMTMTLSSGQPDRKNGGVCAMITQNEFSFWLFRMISKWQDLLESPRPTRVPLRLHARSSRTEKKTQSRLLPSAARRRSLRSGSVPAVSPPALHCFRSPTADRSQKGKI